MRLPPGSLGFIFGFFISLLLGLFQGWLRSLPGIGHLMASAEWINTMFCKIPVLGTVVCGLAMALAFCLVFLVLLITLVLYAVTGSKSMFNIAGLFIGLIIGFLLGKKISEWRHGKVSLLTNKHVPY